MFWTDFKPKKRVNYGVFDGENVKTLQKTMFLNDFLYIYVWVGQRHWHMEKLKKTV